MGDALRQHWPEYLMEAALLGLFMVSACVFATLLGHPASPVAQAITDPLAGRMWMGTAMGLTAIGLIFSPWGQQSGAHINPSVTLTFFRLGKVKGWDAMFYIVAQFAGGTAGVLLASAVLGHLITHPAVNYAVTVPGPSGTGTAFLAEVVISFFMMMMVLNVSNTPKLARLTGVFAGLLVAAYITVEAPISGMSMNPARTFGSAFPAQVWTMIWIYFTAPPLGMLLASEVYVRFTGERGVMCAKLHHDNPKRCIFCGKPGTGPLVTVLPSSRARQEV
jgi:aquaporin Z